MSSAQASTGSQRPGKVGRRSAAKSGGPELYDFRRPTKLSREHVRVLQMVYETFARRMTTLLTSTLRAVSQTTLVSIEQLTYDEYISSLGAPTIMGLVTMEPLPGTCIFEFSLNTAMASVDHMLGGPGGSQPERQLTEIEAPLLRGLIDKMLEELRYGFESLVAIQPRLGAIEYKPGFVQVCAGSDAVVVASFEMRVGAEDCVATFCMPLSTIFPKLNEDQDGPLTVAQRRARDAAHHAVAEGLLSAPVEVYVTFSSLRMTPEELIELRPGDVVRLGHPVGTPLDVISAGITFAHAVPGNQGSRLACLIVPSPEEDINR